MSGTNSSSRWNFTARKLPVFGKIAPVLAALFAGIATSHAALVKEVSIVRLGDAPVDTNSVLAFTSVRAEQNITRNEVSRDVDELRKSGRFSFVTARIEDQGAGVRVIYEVNQKPRIGRIEVTGAEELGNSKVRELLELGAGDLVDDATMAFKRIKVRDEYAKKFFPNAELTWTITTDKETGLCVLKVVVAEGANSHVRKITFPGAKSIKESVLRGGMKQKQHWFFSWITGAGTYKPDDLATDHETVRRIFQDKGFLDAQVGEPVIAAQGKDYLDIEIPVVEGPKYQFGKITISGVTTNIYTTNQVLSVVTNRPGDLAAMSSIEAAAKAVRYKYSGKGYIATRVTPLMSPHPEAGTVDIEMQVVEGRMAYINDVIIRGNRVTKDKVIRREISDAVVPGTNYNEVAIRSSENRLRGLGYFKFVNSTPVETADPSKYDLVFEVEEQRTGNMVVGAGFSSIDNLIGFFELSQGNFSLFDWPPTGGGQKLKLRGTVGSKRRDVEVSFVEPWFNDRKLSLGVDLFTRDERYSSEYHLRNTGGNLTLGRSLGGPNRLNVIYGLQEYNVYDVASDASETIKQEEGSRLKSSVTLELARDTRDNPFIPTRGMRTTLSGQLAGGPFGGDTDIYKVTAQVSKYLPVWWDHVFSIRGIWSSVESYGNSDFVPIFDRLFLGGARTVRGFKYREVGPKDENAEPVGGDTSEFLSLEYTIPLVEKVRYALFYDVGMVYVDSFEFKTSNLNSDWGMGVRFDIPGFPMRLDYAWPIETDAFNDGGGRFQFSLGYGL